MSRNKDGIAALSDVTLAIARAAAEGDARFAERLGANLRDALSRNTGNPRVFENALNWLGRFEEGRERREDDAA